jgi:glycosyltransferase involved in cell wall biosynthesis
VSERASPPLKVALLIATLDQAGAEKQLTLLARNLPRDQFDVDVVALVRGGHYADELRAAGVRVHVLGKRWKLDPGALRALRSLLARLAPDVVHSWMFTANAYARLACGGRGAPPIIVSERGPDDWKSRWQHWVDRWLVARTDLLVVNAPEVARQAAARGFPADRVRVVANGLAVGPAERDTIALDARIRPTARVVGYVGRLAGGKRVADLIAAASLLRETYPEVAFVVAGDGPERAALERRAADLGLGDLVCFVGHRADAAALMSRFDAFWLASENEGMSNSLMEAMAAGAPVVVSDIPGNRDLVADGVTGCTVALGDPRAFAEATVRLWRDPARTAAMTAAAAERVAREFAVERMVERYASLYREVVRNRSTSRAIAPEARGAAR